MELHSPSAARGFVRLTGDADGVVLRLRQRARLVLDVVRSDGTPFFGALVEVMAGDLGWSAQAEGARFECDVEPGAVLVGAVSPGEPLEMSEPLELDVADGVRVERTLRLHPAASIAGRVVDGSGRGIAGARIEWEDSPARRGNRLLAPHPPVVVADGEGRFAAAGFRAGRHVGRVLAPGALARRVEIAAPAEDVRIVVAPTARVRFTVATAAGEPPPADVRLRWFPQADERFALSALLTEADGGFSAALPPGPGRLRVVARPDCTLLDDLIDLPPGADVDLGPLTSPRWREVTGRVEGGVAWATDARVLGPDGIHASPRFREIRADGAFRLQVREGAGRRVLFSVGERHGISRPIAARGPDDVGTVRIAPGGRLRGTVLRKDRHALAPVGDVRWRAVPSPWEGDSPVAADGGFEARLPAGPVRVTVRSPSGAEAAADVEIVDGRTTDVTLRLPE